MPKTFSTMLPLGTKAPDFTLIDTISGKNYSLDELKSDQATVIAFICNHCPYVKHIQQKLVEVANTYHKLGVKFIAICSNDSDSYPEDNPEAMKQEAVKRHYSFPYLYDDTQAVAKAYQAVCTPDFYIFDKSLQCVYRGRFDDATPGNDIAVTGKDICHALDNLLQNKPIDANQMPSVGCSIKWKKT